MKKSLKPRLLKNKTPTNLVIKENKIILNLKKTSIKLLINTSNLPKTFYSTTNVSNLKSIRQKLLSVEKILKDAEYKNSSQLIFLDKKELDNFISFSKLYKQKLVSLKLKYLDSKISSTMIEILKELSAHTNKSNLKENLKFFDNFLDVYNFYKRKKNDEPNKQLFSLMFNSAYKGEEQIKRLKKIISQRYFT